MVFCLPGNEPICIGAVDATRSQPLLQPSGVGKASRLRLSIFGPRQSGSSRQAKIKSRLIADLDPDEWDLPPKPKWMRWRTYNRYVERYDAYEAILDYGIAELMAKFLSK